MSTSAKQPWRSRITRYSEEAPDQLLAHPMNARIHPKAQADALKGVLTDVGIVQNIVVSEATGHVLDGHLRVSLALRDRQPTVPVTWVNVSDDEERLILATLDPLSAAAAWDKEKLDDLLRDVSTDDAAVQQLLADLAEQVGIPSVQPAIAPEDDEVQIDEAGPTRVQAGEGWQLGRHIVACVDSTDRATVERLVSGKRLGMVVADPPYGIKAASSYADGTVHKSMFAPRGKHADIVGDDSTNTAVQVSGLCLDMYPDAVQVWWGANHYANALPTSSCWVVWDKVNPGVQFADAELAWLNQDLAVRIFKHQWSGAYKDSERGERRVHPTQKPVALFLWLYEKYGTADDVIFDPFLGSGPSLKAAEKLGRTIIGCELSPPYLDHILDWWERTTGGTAERLNTLTSYDRSE